MANEVSYDQNFSPSSSGLIPNTGLAAIHLTNLQGPDANGNYYGDLVASLGASTSVIGHVIVDSGTIAATQSGTWTVTVGAALPAGTNVIGHIIVDSAGNVAITSLPALPAGTNVIGHVIVDSASAVAVTSLPALPTGANVIGGVTQSGTWTVQPGNTANTTAWLIAGGKTNNNAVPGATNVGSLMGIANAAAPTWTEGNQVLASMDLSGNQRQTLGTLIAGENLTTNRMNVEPVYSYNNITTQTTTVVKSGAGTLHSIDYTALANGVITIYDNTSAASPVIRTITSPATLLQNEVNKILDLSFATGLTIVTSGANQNIVVGYR